MSVESARTHLQRFGLEDRIVIHEVSTATVQEAAEAVGVIPAQIAKTMAFDVAGRAVLVLCAGDAKVWSSAFKKAFSGCKPAFISPDDLVERIGHPMGGVCPFGVVADVECYLDESLRRFDYVYPAAGSESSSVKVTIDQLVEASLSKGWVDVCKDWREE